MRNPSAAVILLNGEHVGHFEEWELWSFKGKMWNVNVVTDEVLPSSEKAPAPSCDCFPVADWNGAIHHHEDCRSGK